MEDPSYSPPNMAIGDAEDVHLTMGLDVPHANYTPSCHLPNVTSMTMLVEVSCHLLFYGINASYRCYICMF